MPSKSKKQGEPETEHLTELQISELPEVLWEFLVSETGDEVTALQLKPKQLRDYAGDFLDSEAGHFYWPLSNLGQWTCDSTHPEVRKWIGDLMVRHRRKKGTHDFNVDDLDSVSSPRKGKHETAVKASPNPKKKADPLGPRRNNVSRTRDPQTVLQFPRKDAANTSRRAKSPTIALDNPSDMSPQQPLSTPRKSIRPTPASILIAEEKFKSPGTDNSASQARMGLSTSTSTPLKRPVEDDAPVDRSNKKIMLRPSPALPESSSTHSLSFEREQPASTSTPPPPSGTMTPPPSCVRENTAVQTDARTLLSLPTTTTAALGLRFSTENISKVPGQVLGYITECKDHQIRLANNTEDPSLKNEYRARSTLFQKLLADVESRIECLAEGAEERQRVESSHCLWDS